jgi:Domain of unknown function (DUF4383)
MSEWTFAQKALLLLASLELLWGLAGFVAEPSFQIGADAPTQRVLWVDFNGIHALSGLLLFGPALYFCRRPDWALYYVLYIAGALYITGIWAMFEEQPAYVFNFPSNASDGVFHLATAVVFSIVAAVQLREDHMRLVST